MCAKLPRSFFDEPDGRPLVCGPQRLALPRTFAAVFFLREVPAIARAIEKYEVPRNERGGGTDVGRPESGTYEARRAPLPTGRPCGAPSCGDRDHSAGPEKAIGLERLVGDVDVCDAG